MSHEQLVKLIEKMAFDLAEHCSSVQILATIVEDGGTRGIKRGAGDWYARQGMAHEFISANIASDQADEIARRLNPPDDEEWKGV